MIMREFNLYRGTDILPVTQECAFFFRVYSTLQAVKVAVEGRLGVADFQ